MELRLPLGYHSYCIFQVHEDQENKQSDVPFKRDFLILDRSQILATHVVQVELDLSRDPRNIM